MVRLKVDRFICGSYRLEPLVGLSIWPSSKKVLPCYCLMSPGSIEQGFFFDKKYDLFEENTPSK